MSFPNLSFCPVKALISRSEEHTSELQSPCNLVCLLLLEKKKNFVVRDYLLPHLDQLFRLSVATYDVPVSSASCAFSENHNVSWDQLLLSLFFFFNDTASPEIYPLSLPDPLPI